MNKDNNKPMNRGLLALILIGVCILIAVFALRLKPNSEFGGTDDAASDLISEINSDYEVWTSPIFEPPGGETESLLFCLQAAIGAGIIGYGFGVLRERTRKEKEVQVTNDTN